MTYSKQFLAKHKVKNPESLPEEGYVYIIKSGNRFKIGKTKRHPTKRKKDLTLAEAGELIYFQKYKNYHFIEKEIHLLLQDKRVITSEWFEDIDEADLEKIKEWKEKDKIFD